MKCCAGRGKDSAPEQNKATVEPVTASKAAEEPKPTATKDIDVKVPETKVSAEENGTANGTKKMSAPRVAIIYYSTYGHIKQLADEIKKGAESAGAKVTLLQVPETLPKDVLEKMGAAGINHGDPVITREQIGTLGDDYDAYIFGTSTRFGMMAAQMKAFLDSLGQLWQGGKLNGKPAACFTATGTLQGGAETAIMTFIPPLTHLGMVFVPMGYTNGEVMFDMSEIHGGSPWGAHTYAGLDGSRQPSDKERKLATHQGSYVTGIFKKFC